MSDRILVVSDIDGTLIDAGGAGARRFTLSRLSWSAMRRLTSDRRTAPGWSVSGSAATISTLFPDHSVCR